MKKSLFEIEAEYKELFSKLEELALSGEEISDEEYEQFNIKMDENEQQRKAKYNAYWFKQKELKQQADFYKKEGSALQAKGRALENAAERLKTAVFDSMQEHGEEKVDAGHYKLWKAVTKSARVEDESLLPDGTFETQKKPDKKEILKRLKNGEKVPGAILVTKEGVRGR